MPKDQQAPDPFQFRITQELGNIEREAANVRACIRVRTKDLASVDPDLNTLLTIAAASAIEKCFSGMETSLKVIAAELDEPLPKGDAWPRALIDQMAAPTGHRPAVLGAETTRALHNLRAFRHRERNSRSSDLDANRIFALAHETLDVLQGFREDLAAFLEALYGPASSQTDVPKG